jgi:hypothetical protein
VARAFVCACVRARVFLCASGNSLWGHVCVFVSTVVVALYVLVFSGDVGARVDWCVWWSYVLAEVVVVCV